MLRRLSVVFMIGAMLPRPCAAADAGESVVRLFSQEMRQIEANSVELQSQLSSLPPAACAGAAGHRQARLAQHLQNV